MGDVYVKSGDQSPHSKGPHSRDRLLADFYLANGTGYAIQFDVYFFPSMTYQLHLPLPDASDRTASFDRTWFYPQPGIRPRRATSHASRPQKMPHSATAFCRQLQSPKPTLAQLVNRSPHSHDTSTPQCLVQCPQFVFLVC